MFLRHPFKKVFLTRSPILCFHGKEAFSIPTRKHIQTHRQGLEPGKTNQRERLSTVDLLGWEETNPPNIREHPYTDNRKLLA